MSTIVRESFSQKRTRLGGVKNGRLLLEACPPIPPGAPKEDAGYGGYELIDIGRDRWRLQRGEPVAYFRYVSERTDPRWPWAEIWMADGYLG